MALKRALTYQGINLPEAYYKVTTGIHEYKTDELKVVIEIFADQIARENETVLTAESYIAPYADFAVLREEGDENDRASIYRWLKTQPGFENAEDC